MAMNAVAALCRIAGVIAAIGGAACGGSTKPMTWCDPGRYDETVAVASLPDGADAGAGQTTDELVARCQAPARNCQDLCARAATYRANTFFTCELIAGDGGLAVHVVYGAGSCPP
jgi:hypothetical protein